MRNKCETDVNLQPGVSSRVKVSDLRGVHSISQSKSKLNIGMVS